MALETAKGQRPVVLTVDDELGVREAIRQTLQDDCEMLEPRARVVSLSP